MQKAQTCSQVVELLARHKETLAGRFGVVRLAGARPLAAGG
jgi:hypothetical protein